MKAHSSFGYEEPVAGPGVRDVGLCYEVPYPMYSEPGFEYGGPGGSTCGCF